ncbi:D-alanyl-D-alanine carboxypeptidase family protein [Microbacterium sp.]|uniref:D-alanyl-D-alanine carboxypeptidase family protein n=1 Tax=Microbacterium sp. TaxID=51671 RepID=UPI003A8EE2AF
MAYQYVTTNGQRVEKHVAAAFERMRAAFTQQWNLDLLVSSATRTRAEQQRLYDGWIARKPGFNLAAKPPTSNHEEDGPRGPRALDLRDSGRDAGVTVIGSARSNWLAKNAPKFGFTPAGHFFSHMEAWHYEYTGPLAGQTPTPAPAQTGKKHNPFGIPTAVGLQKIARLYGYTGTNDDIWGSGSAGGFAQFLRQNWGYRGNDVLGPIMWAAIARWLRARWGYKGNDVPGPVMRAALQRAEAANRAQLK